MIYRESFPHFADPEPATPAVKPASPEPDVLEREEDGRGTDQPWRVVLYNDEVHTFREVISQIVKATGCAPQKAKDKAWEVHTKGKAVVYEGEFEECFEVQAVLKEIQLASEIEG